MATVQYRLSSRATNGRAEVLVRFYDGESFSQRAKTHVFCPVVMWSVQEGLPAIPKRATVDTIEATDSRYTDVDDDMKRSILSRLENARK